MYSPAAHCYRREKNFSVVLGTHNIDPQRKLKKHAVEHMYKHPEFKQVKSGSDIMLLKLSKEVSVNKGVKLIKFSSKRKPVKPNSKCQVAGWGQNGTKNKVNNLLVTDVSIINTTVCKKEWNKVKENLPPNVLCAGGYKTKSGACQGDSGGPLVCSRLAVGIVSYNLNQNCNYPNVPNVYTEISAYTDWINKVIKGDA